MPNKDEDTNNEVLARLWNDPRIRGFSQLMREQFPNEFLDNEVLVNDKDLKEAGYVGRPPHALLKIGPLVFFVRPALYKNYWIRLKTPGKKNDNLYSIFKEP
jgi:hypothetical protein